MEWGPILPRSQNACNPLEDATSLNQKSLKMRCGVDEFAVLEPNPKP